VKSDAPETKAKSGELIAKGCFYAFGPLTLATFRWSGAEALSGGILLKQLLAASLQLSAFPCQCQQLSLLDHFVYPKQD
jgi:hypothetical protein